MKTRDLYARHRFPPVIIRYAVWLYHRFSLSFRDVEDMLAQRGVIVSYETVRHSGLDFVNEIEAAVATVDVLFCVMGTEWLTIADENGKRRLDDPMDFVRVE